jgi:hypothetical protein
LPTGEGTGLKWYYKETTALPKASKLTLRFKQTSTAVVFRLDDISVFQPTKSNIQSYKVN